MSSASTVSVVVAHLIQFLTRPLRDLPAAQLDRLATSLHVNLSSHFAPTWRQTDPGRGRVHRKLALSGSCPPPRPIELACTHAQLRWSFWFAALGGQDMTIYADPDALIVRKGTLDAPCAGVMTLWSAPASKRPVRPVAAQAQDMSSDDDEEVFSLLESARRAEWAAQAPPRINTQQFARRAASPSSSDSDVPSLVSAASASSRSSSVASGVYVPPSRRPAHLSHSRGSSVSSSPAAADIPRALVYARAAAALAVAGSNALYDADKLGGTAPVHVDMSRLAVTPYDGGKTTVLTGGTLLGVPRPRRA